jgi:O-antigen ligase
VNLRLETKSKLPVITGVVTTLIVFPWAMDPINTPKLFVLLFGSGVSLFLATYNSPLRILCESNKILLTLTTIIIVLIVASSIVNPQNLYSDFIGFWRRNNGMLQIFGSLMLFFSVIFSRGKDIERYIIQTLAGLGILFGIYSWFQFRGMDLISALFPWYNSRNVIALTLGNSNFASIFLGITFTATLGMLFAQGKYKISGGILFISLINQWLLVRYIDTQGKIVYALGGSIVLAAWLLSSSKKKIKSLGILWVCLAFVTGLLGILGIVGQGPFSNMLSNNVINLKDRYYHWQAAMEMMRSFPFFGVGIDNFGDFYREFRSLDAIALRGTAMSGTDNAHNVFAQLGATIGIPFLLTYITLILFITFKGFRNLFLKENKVIQGTLIAIWMILIVNSLISVDQIGVGVWQWIVGGAMIGTYSSSNVNKFDSKTSKRLIKKNEKNSSKVILTLRLLFALMPAVSSIPAAWNDYRVFQVWQKFDSSSTQDQALSNSKNLVKVALESNQSGLRDYISNTLAKNGFLDEALQLSIETSQKYPRDFVALNIIAAIYESQGRIDLAISTLDKIVMLDPLNTEIKSHLESLKNTIG